MSMHICLILTREGSDETLYYSCKDHLDDLINSLEEDGKEKRLLSAIKAKYKIMAKHMEITEALTEAARGMYNPPYITSNHSRVRVWL